jgi:hypothetical protein
MLTTYKTAEQKYLFEAYANEEGFITQETVDKLSDMLSDDVYVRPEGGCDYKTKATNAEKKFLAQLLGAGLLAIRDGGEFYSVANALEYMFVRWNSDSKGRHLNSYLTFYCPLARLCGRGEKENEK